MLEMLKEGRAQSATVRFGSYLTVTSCVCMCVHVCVQAIPPAHVHPSLLVILLWLVTYPGFLPSPFSLLHFPCPFDLPPTQEGCTSAFYLYLWTERRLVSILPWALNIHSQSQMNTICEVVVQIQI